MDCPEVWARIAILNGQTQAAEVLYLEQNQVEKAIEMYLSLHKWENGNSTFTVAKFRFLLQLHACYKMMYYDSSHQFGRIQEPSRSRRVEITVSFLAVGNVSGRKSG